MIPIFIIAIVVVGLILYFISTYNRFFSLKNSAEATLGQVRVALKKRLDMIEQLVDSVKSYAKFEREVMEKVTSLRSNVFKTGPEGLKKIDSESRGILGNILAVAESYPDLKTSETVKTLMGSVKDIEGEIARHRYTYNNIGQEFNIMCDTIPSKFVAQLIAMKKIEYLEFEEDIEKRPSIEF